MSQRPKKITHHIIPIYETRLSIYRRMEGHKAQKAARKAMKFDGIEMGDCAGQVVTVDGEAGCWVHLHVVDDKCLNTVAHECVHAAWRTLDAVGVECNESNHEALAYLTGYIAELVQRGKAS